MEVKNTKISSPLPGERVNGSEVDKTRSAELAKFEAAKAKRADKNNGVDVSLSPQAKEMEVARQKAFEIAKNTPSIRQDRVADIKAKIQNGTYEIDSGKIADGMLREAIKDHLAITDRY